MVHLQSPDIVARNVVGENLLVPVSGPLAKRNSLFTLNPIGSAVWSLIDGQRTDDEVVAELVARYPEDPQRVRTETLQFIAEMERLGVIRPASAGGA